MQTTIYLVRHGKTEWNEKKRMQGHTDVPLNATGLSEAKMVGKRLMNDPLNAIYSSPMKRAYQTALEINKHHNLSIVQINRLKEGGFGIFEGLTWHELKSHPLVKDKPKKVSRYYENTGGSESIHDVYIRTSSAIEEILNKHANQAICLVCHGLVIKTLLLHAGLVSKNNIEKLEVINAYPYNMKYDYKKKTYLPIDIPKEYKRS